MKSHILHQRKFSKYEFSLWMLLWLLCLYKINASQKQDSRGYKNAEHKFFKQQYVWIINTYYKECKLTSCYYVFVGYQVI